MHQFLSVVPPDRALAAWLPHIQPIAGRETVPLDQAWGRVAAATVYAPHHLPGFRRSTVDGYAVRARDTYGASEGLPAILTVVGEVAIGQMPGIVIQPGETVWVPTGAAIPEGADAMVMLEYTETLGDLVQISRPAAPGDYILMPDEDVPAGTAILQTGQCLGPGEIGLLAALGITMVDVIPRPRTVILSTGDEIVPIETAPGPGQIRDINRHTLTALIGTAGGVITGSELLRDEEELVAGAVQSAAGQADLVILSGGSSVGNRDFTLHAINRAGNPGVIVHGIAIRPGKPTILAALSGVPVIGLPGHPVSAMLSWRLFGTAALAHMQRTAPPARWVNRAVLESNLPSASGIEDYIRVRIDERDGIRYAQPVLGKSGLISTMVGIDGILKVPAESEGFQAGDIVEVEQL